MQKTLHNLISSILIISLGIFDLPGVSSAYAMNPLDSNAANNTPEVSADGNNNSNSPVVPTGSLINFLNPVLATNNAVINSNISSTVVSNLPHRPNVTLNTSNTNSRPDLPGYATFVAKGESSFGYRYDIGAGTGATVEAEIMRSGQTFDFSSTPFRIAIQRTNANESVAGVSQMSLVFTDDQGREFEERVTLSTTLTEYEVDLSTAPSFDPTKVSKITLKQTFTDLPADFDTQQEQRAGEIFVTLGGLNLPDPKIGLGFNADTLSDLNSDLQITSRGFNTGTASVPGFVTLAPISAGVGSFRYNVSHSPTAAIAVDLTRKSGLPFRSFSGGLVFAAKSSVSGDKVLIKTSNGTEEKSFLLSLTDSFGNFVLNFDGDDPFTPNEITSISAEIIRNYSVNGSGVIDFHLPLDVTYAAFNQEGLQKFSSNTTVTGNGFIQVAGSVPGFITMVDPIDNVHAFRFDVGGSASAAVQATIERPDGSENFTDLLGDPSTLALKADKDQTQVNVNFLDGNGNKRTFLTELTTDFQNISFDFNSPSVLTGTDFDVSDVQNVTLEIVRGMTPERSGRIDFYVPLLDPFEEIVPTIDSITFDAIGNSTVDFPDVADAAVYHVQVATDADFTNIVHEGFPGASSESFSLSDSGTYFFRVRASKSAAVETGPVTQWSAVDQRTITLIKDIKPTINSANTGSDAITRVLYNSVSGAVVYKVQIATDSSFTNIVHEGFPTGTAEPINLENNGDYFVRVQASATNDFAAGTVSQFSDTFSFTRNFVDRTIQPDGTLTAENITDFPDGTAGAPGVTSLGSGGDSFDLAIARERGVTVNFDTGSEAGGSGGFAGGGFTYDDFGTDPAIETGDLSGLTDLVFGIQGDASRVKFEIVDSDGNSEFVALEGIKSDEEQFWKIPISFFSTIDLTKVRIMYFIVEGHDQSGTLIVHRIKPTANRNIQPNDLLTNEDLTVLPDGIMNTSIGSGGDSSDSTAAAERGTVITYNTGTSAGGSGGFAGGGFTYDDPSTTTATVESADLSGFDNFVFEVKGDASQVKVEFKDVDNNSSSVFLQQISSTVANIYSIPKTLLTGIDLSRISFIYFIVEGFGNSGTLEVNHLKPSLNRFIGPSVGLDNEDLTVLPAGIATTGLSSGGDSSDSVTAGERGASIGFNTGTSAGGSAGFAGGGFTYDDGGTVGTTESADLSGFDNFIFEVQGPIANAKVEFVDSTGAKSFVFLKEIASGAAKIYSIPKALLTGIDLTKISFIYFIIEGFGQSGTMEVNHLKPSLNRFIGPSAGLDNEDLTVLPAGIATTGLSSGGDSSDSVTAGERGASIGFNTGTSAGGSAGFAGGGFTYDDGGTVGTTESADLSGFDNFIFEVQGPIANAKVEFVDSTGAKSFVFLKEIASGAAKIYSIPKALLTGIDLTKISFIYFIIEGFGQSGTMEVNHLKPSLSRFIGPSTGLTDNDITNFPNNSAGNPLGVTSLGSGGDSFDLALAQTRGVRVLYDTGTAAGNSGGFAGGGFVFDDFGTDPAIETGDLSGLSELAFGVQGDVSQVKFEVVDSTGASSSVTLKDIKDDAEQIYSIPTALLTGVDLSKTRIMYFIVEGHGNSGALTINRLPSSAVSRNIQPSAGLTSEDITDFPKNNLGEAMGRTSLGSGGDSSDSSADGERGVVITYSTGTVAGSSGGFAGGGFAYDNFGTSPAIETGDWSSLNKVVFEVKGDAPTVKLEVVDENDNKSSVTLENIDPNNLQRYEIATALFSGVNLAKVRLVYFIVEGHGNSGQMTINNVRPSLSRNLPPDASLTANDITNLPNGTAGGVFNTSLGSGGDSSDAAVATARGVAVVYNTGTAAGGAGGFAGGGFTFDDFGGDPIEHADLSGLSELIFGIKGDASNLKLEIVDASGNSNFVHLNSILSGTEQFWKIPLSHFTGINLAQVRIIYFIVEGHGNSGQLEINRLP